MNLDLPLTELARRLRSGELRPLEVVGATLDRLDRVEPHVNAFITRRDDAALDEARRLEASSASVVPRGALYGVPVPIKDNIAVAGLPVTAGSRVGPPDPALVDATSVQRLRPQGAIVIGKTNLHEFAYGATSVNSHFGDVKNP